MVVIWQEAEHDKITEDVEKMDMVEENCFRMLFSHLYVTLKILTLHIFHFISQAHNREFSA